MAAGRVGAERAGLRDGRGGWGRRKHRWGWGRQEAAGYPPPRPREGRSGGPTMRVARARLAGEVQAAAVGLT